ncbi:hypothetical protein G647_00652 [Cladophialophora carrionii CBS 160.54]|uniref:Dynactin subunit 6 n=1 Tax=Cladophialophora carrionii CBS 160.54 TaxID=1279043 RepID=V9DPG0_9EURO|nr:uncharacterized protein G647_00652 [Cladophialophora carrionii CBS 160.54]ETI28203.1 hypothetical protein G647_00652 [Cladophialophora carrionii CBS 160.54]
MSAPAAPSTSQASSRPPVTLGQNTHLDPGAYVRGTHAITLGEHILVHPRAQLIAIHGPLSISDKCIISEKCVIGGPVPGASTTDPSSKAAAGGSNPPTPLLGQPGEGDDDEQDPVKTTIGSNVYMHPSSQVHAGATIKDSVLIEPHVTILANVTVGAHAKICAGVTVDRDVEEWTVVYGRGDVKRRRKTAPLSGNTQDDAPDVVEMLRLKAMDKEREGTVSIFRTAARANLTKKK